MIMNMKKNAPPSAASDSLTIKPSVKVSFKKVTLKEHKKYRVPIYKYLIP